MELGPIMFMDGEREKGRRDKAPRGEREVDRAPNLRKQKSTIVPGQMGEARKPEEAEKAVKAEKAREPEGQRARGPEKPEGQRARSREG